MLIFNPRQTVLISCRGKASVIGKVQEKDDVLPCSWHCPVSSHPPLYAIFVEKSLMAVSIIRDSGCFVVNFVSFSFVDKIKSAMSISGDFSEKLNDVGFVEASCEKLVDCFRLKEALGHLECELVEEKELGDRVMFVGKVLFSNLVRDDNRPFHVEGDRFTTTR